MQIEVKVPESPERKEHERRTVVVETHGLRGETFIVLRTDQLLEGETKLLDAPAGGRIILTVPKEADMVFDKEQNAAVRTVNQQNEEGRADRPAEHPTPRSLTPEEDAELRAKAAEETRKREADVAAAQRLQAQRDAEAKRQAEQQKRDEAAQKAKEAQEKAAADAKAKAQAQAGQQSGASTSPDTPSSADKT